MRHARPTPARAGVTLIELLVVMMIIAILAALSLSAVFSVRESQMKSFTETLINKLASALDGQWKAAIDQIREEPVPPWAVALAGNDPQRAKVVYLKARLSQEFPVTFERARRPLPYPNPGNAAQDFLKAKPAFANVPTGSPPYQASALLYLTLTQGRRGMAGFNPEEHVEPSAIQTIDGLKVFVDSWGAPLSYFAFPYYNDELNTAPYYDTSKPQNQQSPDPLDPDRLVPLNFNNPTFNTYIHPTNLALRHLIPVVASAGRDGLWGLGPDVRFMQLQSADQANDNIYSYRLRRSGARGD